VRKEATRQIPGYQFLGDGRGMYSSLNRWLGGPDYALNIFGFVFYDARYVP
jgi:hypothetical protein